jgi:predicted RNA-binding Zn-ribbon protein involved in translation (DUF1610 family)
MTYRYCNKCEETIHPNRYKLGYRTCLACGDEVAQRLAEVRKKQVAPSYNKGAYQYITLKILKLSGGSYDV